MSYFCHGIPYFMNHLKYKIIYWFPIFSYCSSLSCKCFLFISGFEEKNELIYETISLKAKLPQNMLA